MKRATKFLTLATILLSLTACSSGSNEIYALDGLKAQKVTCRAFISGNHVDPADCYEKAGKVCGARGYEVVGEPYLSQYKMGMLVRCNSF